MKDVIYKLEQEKKEDLSFIREHKEEISVLNKKTKEIEKRLGRYQKRFDSLTAAISVLKGALEAEAKE